MDAGRLERVRLDPTGLHGLVAKRPGIGARVKTWRALVSRGRGVERRDLTDLRRDGRNGECRCRRRGVDGAAQRYLDRPRHRSAAAITDRRRQDGHHISRDRSRWRSRQRKRRQSVRIRDDLGDRQSRCRGCGAQRQPLAGHRPVLRIADVECNDRLRAAVAWKPVGSRGGGDRQRETRRSCQTRSFSAVKRAADRPETRDQDDNRASRQSTECDLHHHPLPNSWGLRNHQTERRFCRWRRHCGRPGHGRRTSHPRASR